MRVRIGLYTLSSMWGFRIGCRIAKGVSERCIARLLLTQHLRLLERGNATISYSGEIVSLKAIKSRKCNKEDFIFKVFILTLKH